MTEPDWTENHAQPNVAAGVLFTDEQDRVLMIIPSYKDYLDIPGGYVENGETPYQAAQREVLEELGITPAIGPLLVTEWRQDSPETGLGAKLLLIFDGGCLSADQVSEIQVDGDEVSGYQFCAIEATGDLTIDRLQIRIAASLESRQLGSPIYLENGRTTGGA